MTVYCRRFWESNKDTQLVTEKGLLKLTKETGIPKTEKK